MDASNHSQMTTALQVFHNLETLKEEVTRRRGLTYPPRLRAYTLDPHSPLFLTNKVTEVLQKRQAALVEELRQAFTRAPDDSHKTAKDSSSSAESGERTARTLQHRDRTTPPSQCLLVHAPAKHPMVDTSFVCILLLAAVRAAIWSSVERAIGRIQAVSAQFRALHRVLLKKRSQVVHLTFAELVEVNLRRRP